MSKPTKPTNPLSNTSPSISEMAGIEELFEIAERTGERPTGPHARATAESRAATAGRVSIKVYDVDGDAADALPERWHEMPRDAKMASLKLLEWADLGPTETIESGNTICVGLDQYRAATMMPDATGAALDAPADLAFGEHDDENPVEPDYTDTSLPDEIHRTTMSSHEVSGSDLTVYVGNTFLDTNEANGNTIGRIGIVSASGVLFNHSAFEPFEKTSTRAATVETVLSFEPYPED